MQKNVIYNGDCVEILKGLPSESIDMIFADPPYYMQTNGVLLRTEGTPFKGVDDEWDKFEDYAEYDAFCNSWLKECRRVLKRDGSIFVIGAFQNIYRIGFLMQNMGFWVLNDIIWNKTNPAPNFKATRFTNASETMLWCAKSEKSKYTFNYKTMKELNGGKQMRSVWNIGLCVGDERLKDKEGKKAHNTQKPEKLLFNCIIASTKVDDTVLDPFLGSGTTAAVAKSLGRNYIGIEKEEQYVELSKKRVDNVTAFIDDYARAVFDIKPPRVSVKQLIEKEYLRPGEHLYDKNGFNASLLTEDGAVKNGSLKGSIHKVSAQILGLSNNNGWDFWTVKRGDLISIDHLRKEYREKELQWKN